MITSLVRRVRELGSTISDDRRERREARTAYRKLELELASYRTPREIDDLLGSISTDDGPDAEQIRQVLLGNVRPTRELYSVS